LCYGHRGFIKNLLNENENFIFKDKSDKYTQKKDYFSELSDFNFGLSLNGAAKICYRDLEYFGMGVLNLREKLDILTKEPILENVHYLNFFDVDLHNLIYNPDNKKLVNDFLDNRLDVIIKEGLYTEIVNNSLEWFNRNCTLISQLQTLYSFLEESQTI
jgi:hypothetical protein